MDDTLGSYDLIEEIKLHKYRVNNMQLCDIWSSYEQPDKAKWRNKDCLQCSSVFSVRKKDRKSKKWKCYNCGEIYVK